MIMTTEFIRGLLKRAEASPNGRIDVDTSDPGVSGGPFACDGCGDTVWSSATCVGCPDCCTEGGCQLCSPRRHPPASKV